MKHIFYVVMLAGAMFLASCATNRTVSYTTFLDAQNYVVDVTPMVATLQVETTHTMGDFQWVGKKRAVVNYDELRDNAIFNALKKCKADVLVAPQYQFVTEVRGGTKTIKVSVLGYPAKYINFKPAPKQEVLEVKEMKNDANYVLVTKDSNGAVCNYQVVVPYDKDIKTLDLEDATVEKVILDGNKAKLGRGRKAPKCDGDKKEGLGKMIDKASKKK